jgi:hypothetical protein
MSINAMEPVNENEIFVVKNGIKPMVLATSSFS